MNPIADLLNASQIGYPKETEFQTMITLGHNEDDIPMLVPVICPVGYLKALRDGNIRYADTLSYFPPEYGWGMRSKIHLQDNQMKESSIPCILNDFTFFETDFIDTEKFDQLRGLTRERGGVFFKFIDAKMQPSLQFLMFLKRKYKYNAVFHEHETNPLFFKADPKKKDELEIFVSFIDLKNAIPIFDTRKADGLAVAISLIKEGTNFYDVAIVFSNNRKNLFVVDGQLINQNAKELTLRGIAQITKRIREIIFCDPKAMDKKLKERKISDLNEMYGGTKSTTIEFKINEEDAPDLPLDEPEQANMAEEEAQNVEYVNLNSGPSNYNTAYGNYALWYAASTTDNTDDSDTSNNG